MNINGYSIMSEGNRNGGGVACYIRSDLCFNTKNLFSNSFQKKNFFFEILIPNVQHVAIGIFYRPPNANDFLNIFSNNL